MSPCLAFCSDLAHTENMQVVVHNKYTLVVALHTARLDKSGRLRAGVSIPQECGLIPWYQDSGVDCLYLGSAGFLLFSTIQARCGGVLYLLD